MIESHHENASFEGAAGMKQGLRKRSLHGYVLVNERNTSTPSPQGAGKHPIEIIERDATWVGNVNHFTYSRSVIAETAGCLCCLKGEDHD